MPTFEEALAMQLHEEKQLRKGLKYPPRWEDRTEEARNVYRSWALLVVAALSKMDRVYLTREPSAAELALLAAPGKIEQWPG